MSGVARALHDAADRLRPRPRDPHDEYVLCPVDGFWFRPPYTAGKCPLCGEIAPGGAPPLPLMLRIDRLSLGMAAFVLTSLAMSALVLFTYYKA